MIFAKGYVEKINYVTAGKQLPKLSVEDMERIAAEYGLTDEVFEKNRDLEKSSLSEERIEEK